MHKTKLIIHEGFNGKQSLETVCLSVFQSESYLGSKYYDSEDGRFISADTTDILDVQSDFYL